MSRSLNIKGINLKPLLIIKKGSVLGLYILMFINCLASLSLAFMVLSERSGYMATLENKQKILTTNTPFLFHDLPLPLWVQGFMMPIAGAKVPQDRSLLPGARRAYRNGRHEGVDLVCPYGTPVLAAKSGHVIFAGTNYIETPFPYRNRLLKLSQKLFKTPPAILQVLHGRRVLLDQGVINGRWVVTVYSHLSRIKESLKIGDYVKKGAVIGYVGNSGTSKAGSFKGAHLHFEIRANEHYLGEGMSPENAGRLYAAILEGNRHGKSGGDPTH